MMKRNDNNISELIKKIIIENDETAFSIIYEKYKISLFHYIKVIDINLSDDTIFDIIQDTFIKMYKYLKNLNDFNKFEFWLFRIAKNTFYNYKRKNKHIRTNSLEFSIDTIKSPNTEKNYLRSIKRYEILNSFFHTLSSTDSIIFFQKAFEGKSINTIAENTQKTKRQVQYGLEKIYKKLKKFLKKNNIHYEDLDKI